MKTLLASLLLLSCLNPVVAQKPLPPNAPGEPHAALARLAGNWKAQALFWIATNPSAAPTQCTATVKAHMIMGGRFLFQNVEGQCMGQPLEAIGVIGYDNATRRFQAVSFSNTGTSMPRHVGERNDAGDIVLHLSYEDPATDATVTRRTVRTLISDNEWIETAHEIRNGTELKVMEIRARRTSARVSNKP